MFHRVCIVALFLAFLVPAAGCAAPSASGISRLGYSIQVGAFSEVKNAERLTSKLQDKGIEAFYFRKENNVYAVRFGDFPTKEAAQKGARKLVSDRLIGSYFIAPPTQASLRPVVSPGRSTSSDKQLQVRATSSGKQVKETGDYPQLPGSKEKPQEDGGRDMGYIAARTAERFVGIPYRWGGNTVVDGLDCSGFARAVYNLCGVNIPRNSGEQYRVGQAVEKGELKDGDLVFFGASTEQISHVGIYVGKGKFVHAPRRGDDIKISSLDENYYTKKFIGGRRYF